MFRPRFAPFPNRRFLFLVGSVFCVVFAVAAYQFASADKSPPSFHSPPPSVRSAPPVQKPSVVQVIDLYLGFGGFEPDDIPDAKPGPALITIHDLRGDRRQTTYRLTAPDGRQTALAAASGTTTNTELDLSPVTFVVTVPDDAKAGACKITVVKE